MTINKDQKILPLHILLKCLSELAFIIIDNVIPGALNIISINVFEIIQFSNVKNLNFLGYQNIYKLIGI